MTGAGRKCSPICRAARWSCRFWWRGQLYELGRFGKKTELATMAALEQHLRTGLGTVAASVGEIDIASFWLSALQ